MVVNLHLHLYLTMYHQCTNL